MILRITAACFILLGLSLAGFAQKPETKNVIVVTLDGFRWQEVFGGADPAIMCNEKYVSDSAVGTAFWNPAEAERRRLLMPFLWEVINGRGQVYGNRNYDNRVNCLNNHLLSYPGYSEMLVGFRDRKITSNRKVENPNPSVLEHIAAQPGFQDQVAAFATWDAFPYILRAEKSDIYVSAGNTPAEGKISGKEEALNAIQEGVRGRTDSLTFLYAMEYMKRKRPRVLFLGFDETDQHAHAGRYDRYLQAAHQADSMISQLWGWVQSQVDYRDQTTLLITTDHGRGNGRNNWRKHRLLAGGSRHIWMAVMGPDTPAFGEMKYRSTIYQNQVAKTVASFLGLPFGEAGRVGEVVQTMIAVPHAPGAPVTAKNTR